MVVEAWIVWGWFRHLSGNELGEEQSVGDDVEGQKAKERLGEKLRFLVTDSLKVENLLYNIIHEVGQVIDLFYLIYALLFWTGLHSKSSYKSLKSTTKKPENIGVTI